MVNCSIETHTVGDNSHNISLTFGNEFIDIDGIENGKSLPFSIILFELKNDIRDCFDLNQEQIIKRDTNTRNLLENWHKKSYKSYNYRIYNKKYDCGCQFCLPKFKRVNVIKIYLNHFEENTFYKAISVLVIFKTLDFTKYMDSYLYESNKKKNIYQVPFFYHCIYSYINNIKFKSYLQQYVSEYFSKFFQNKMNEKIFKHNNVKEFIDLENYKLLLRRFIINVYLRLYKNMTHMDCKKILFDKLEVIAASNYNEFQKNKNKDNGGKLSDILNCQRESDELLIYDFRLKTYFNWYIYNSIYLIAESKCILFKNHKSKFFLDLNDFYSLMFFINYCLTIIGEDNLNFEIAFNEFTKNLFGSTVGKISFVFTNPVLKHSNPKYHRNIIPSNKLSNIVLLYDNLIDILEIYEYFIKQNHHKNAYFITISPQTIVKL
ncbi:hypothetical protein COBT_001109, partial [Conglomerata obtusa]